MVEREMKFLVSKAEFERLIVATREVYPDASVQIIKQTNYYYDTEDFALLKQGVTLRIREKNGQLSITRKEYQTCVNGVRTAEETKTSIDALPEHIDGYALLGCLHTERTRFSLTNGTRLDFDVSRYIGVEDYEIEIEFEEQLPEAFIRLLPAEFNPRGKYERFLEQTARKSVQ